MNPYLFTPYNEKHPKPLLAVVDNDSVQFFRLPWDKRKAYGLTVRLSLSVALDFGSFVPLRAVNTECGDNHLALEPAIGDERNGVPSLAGARNGVIRGCDNHSQNGYDSHIAAEHKRHDPLPSNGIK